MWLPQKIWLLQAIWQLAWTPGCQIDLKAAALFILLHCMTHGNFSQERLLEILRQIHCIILFIPAQFNVPFPTYGSDCADWLHMMEPLAPVLSSNFLVVNECPKHLISILVSWLTCLIQVEYCYWIFMFQCLFSLLTWMV